jgi:ribonuclease-3
MSFPFKEIEEKIGYAFNSEQLLKIAFTHSTYANQMGGKDNERMEYLGDAVLQLIVTEQQFLESGENEGVLTRGRQKLVCEDALYNAVKKLDIEKYLLIVGGKSNVGKKTVSSLYETVLAAIYLDGGYDKAKAFVFETLLNVNSACDENPKGELQEFLQGKGWELPVYTSKKKGQDNAPVFECTVRARGKTAYGEGGSKRQAEQNAAKALLEQLI